MELALGRRYADDHFIPRPRGVAAWDGLRCSCICANAYFSTRRTVWTYRAIALRRRVDSIECRRGESPQNEQLSSLRDDRLGLSGRMRNATRPGASIDARRPEQNRSNQ